MKTAGPLGFCICFFGSAFFIIDSNTRFGCLIAKGLLLFVCFGILRFFVEGTLQGRLICLLDFELVSFLILIPYFPTIIFYFDIFQLFFYKINFFWQVLVQLLYAHLTQAKAI